MIPERPANVFNPHEDEDAASGWLLARIDEDPDRVALVSMPPAATEPELDAYKDAFRRAYEHASADRPALSVKLLHGRDVGHGPGNGPDRSRVVAVLHEHRWFGGACVHGCRHVRPVDGDNAGGVG
jgi:hypothetical protein